MKLCNTLETWRENLGDLRDELDEGDIETASEILRDETLREIVLRDGNYTTCYVQSVGVGSIFQWGTDAERALFCDALDAALVKTRESAPIYPSRPE